MLLNLLCGLIVGFALGLTGGGGSIFAVPLLVYGLGTPVHEAVVISLAVVGITSLGGGLARLRGGEAELRTAVIFGLAGILGAPLGAWLHPQFPETVLLAGFALLMLAVATRIWRRTSQRPEEARIIICAGSDEDADAAGPACRYDPGGQLRFTSRCAARLALTGSVTGLLSGLFGVGGGFLIVPALVLIGSLPMRRAVATSLWVIAIISALGLASHVLAGARLDLELTAGFIAGGLAGMALGIVAGRRLAGPTLQKIFAGMIVAVATFMLVRLAVR